MPVGDLALLLSFKILLKKNLVVLFDLVRILSAMLLWISWRLVMFH